MACLVVQQFLVYLPKRSSSCFKLERTMLFSVVKDNKFNISIFPCTFNKKKPFSTSVSFVEKFSPGGSDELGPGHKRRYWRMKNRGVWPS